MAGLFTRSLYLPNYRQTKKILWGGIMILFIAAIITATLAGAGLENLLSRLEK
jgi:hypothetical protein